MKRVLHVLGSLNRGGAETMIMNIYRLLDKEKIQFDFLVHNDGTGEYEKEVINMGGRVFHLSNPSSIGLIKYQKSLSNLLRKKGPFQAVHSYVNQFSGIIVKISKNEKIPINIVHIVSDKDGKKVSLKRKIYKKYTRYLIKKNADVLIGCSVESAKYLYGDRYYKDERYIHIPNPVDPSKFIDLKRCINLNDSTTYGHVGRFIDVKNHTFIIEIFSHIKKVQPKAKLLLIGEGPLISKVKEKVQRLELNGNVEFLGIRSDIPEVLSKIDVMIFPSLYEGVPLALLEAQLAQVKILTSDTVSKEVDLEANQVEFLSLARTAQEWATSAINLSTKKLVSKEYIFMQLNNKNYNAIETVEKYYQIYRINKYTD